MIEIYFSILLVSFVLLLWNCYENDDISGCEGIKENFKHSKTIQICRHQIKIHWFRIVFSSPWIPFETRGIYIYKRFTLLSLLWMIREQFARIKIYFSPKNISKVGCEKIIWHSSNKHGLITSTRQVGFQFIFLGMCIRIHSTRFAQAELPFRKHPYGPFISW